MLKVLGQSRPGMDVDDNVYVCPVETGAVVSTLAVCNTGNAMAFFTVGIRPNGASYTDLHRVFSDVPVSASDTFAATCGFTLSAGDIVTVTSSSGEVSFSLFGQEVAQ